MKNQKRRSADLLRSYSTALRKAGFVRVSAWLSADAVRALDAAKQPKSCRGRTLERILTGAEADRPWPPE